MGLQISFNTICGIVFSGRLFESAADLSGKPASYSAEYYCVRGSALFDVVGGTASLLSKLSVAFTPPAQIPARAIRSSVSMSHLDSCAMEFDNHHLVHQITL